MHLVSINRKVNICLNEEVIVHYALSISMSHIESVGYSTNSHARPASNHLEPCNAHGSRNESPQVGLAQA